jgi:hypothetical protein
MSRMALELDREAVMSCGSFIQIHSFEVTTSIQGFVIPSKLQEESKQWRGKEEARPVDRGFTHILPLNAHDGQVIDNAPVEIAAD